jgi:hypothetical protein
MTICIAAICDNSTVIALADRLVTSGAHQYQPAKSKIYQITRSIIAMLSCEDAAIASELLDEVIDRVSARIKANPNAWWSVKETAKIWREVYIERQQREAETAILAPIGLTMQSWLQGNAQLHQSLVDRVSNELLNFSIPGGNASIIFCGHDGTGPHLYVARNDAIRCLDVIGYATVGSGAEHARSQFISSSHSTASPLNRALFDAYAGKRRAESAPGVGQETDFYYTWAAGYGSTIRDEIIESLKKTYDKMVKANAKTLNDNLGRLDNEIKRIIEPALSQPDQQQVPKDENPPAPADDKKAGGEEANVKKAE